MFWGIKFHTYNLRVLHELKVIAIEHEHRISGCFGIFFLTFRVSEMTVFNTTDEQF